MRDVILSSVVVAAVGLSASSGLAQSFNIDFGNHSPTPTASYGAASGQTGYWNTYLGPTIGLLDLAASPTGVTISGGTASFLAGANDPLTLGNDEALLDNYLAIPTIDTYTVLGLAAGMYNVYCYTWTFGPLSTVIDVNSQGAQNIGGVWTGSFAAGNYSLHTVTLAASQPLVIDALSIGGALGSVAGVQIISVPGPGAAGLLGLAGMVAARRRR